jgi:hypothetical protein
MASYFMRFLNHIRRTTVGRTPTDGWSARRRDFYLTTHSSYKRQTSMSPAGFEPTISAGEWPQNYALDRTATGTGIAVTYPRYINKLKRGTERLNWFNEQWHDKILTEDGMHVLLFSNQMNLWECCTTKTTTKKHTSCSQSVNYERDDKYTHISFPSACNVLRQQISTSLPYHNYMGKKTAAQDARTHARARAHARTHAHTHTHVTRNTICTLTVCILKTWY